MNISVEHIAIVAKDPVALKSWYERVLGAKAVVRFYASEGSANPEFVRKEVEAWKVRLRDEGAIPGKGKKKRKG